MLSIENIWAGYTAVPVLRGVSASVAKGEIVTVLSANGAGKTTLFRIISGLLAPRSGRVQLDGVTLTGRPAYQVVHLGIGQVPEGRQLFTELSALDNLQLAAHYGGRLQGRVDMAERLDFVCEVFPLQPLLNKRAGALSGGEQQMLAIARALMTRPSLLVLDEPCLGLAPLAVQKLAQAIQMLNREGLTVLITEQNTQLAAAVSHRTYFMKDGCLTESIGNRPGREELWEAYLGRIGWDGGRA